ncbi:deoxyribonuclease V [Pseudoxanthomonas winnipegensis]|uniref:deoxyribonuclease V n=1 Tax=Pseudoxanthomonas winnipegensis TaxID=2480810 RepID=UPI00103A79B1|nr:deoxyribonuclease V [Pseudoxanthomonas winnipegensis]TBV69499.1 deoxyribonuclease V [Pseudoxanthomonas winnipegensis]
MTSHVFAGWDGSIAGARALQERLAARVVLEDRVPAAPRTIAGFDVGFEDEGHTTRAAAVLLEGTSLQLIASTVQRVPTSMPYVPGLLSFRELPALVQALEFLPQVPDLVVVDGQGIAHPRRLGIAAHFGVVTGLPTLGVAKQVLCGRFEAPGPQPGEHTLLIHRGEQIGWALRSKLRCNPLIISPGFGMTMDGALTWTRALLRGYRLPEPTRLADRLASRRGPMPGDTPQLPLA